MWSFVQRKKNKRWVWLAQCRRTRQIVAYALGDRSEKTCALLWKRVPKPYKKALLYTDFWKAYQKVLPKKRHRPTDKGDGQTCHRRALQQHPASADGEVCEMYAFILEDGRDARQLPAPVST